MSGNTRPGTIRGDGVCACCGGLRAGPDANSGYCRTCCRRWADHGYPPGGPPPLRHRAADVPAGEPVPLDSDGHVLRDGTGRTPAQSARAGRMADVLSLLAAGTPGAQIAARFGISRRTVHRYAARARAGGELAVEAAEQITATAAAAPARPRLRSGAYGTTGRP